MDEIQVPTYFLCPISLEIMKDPVILSTGITYDRICIEKWILSRKNNTCPVTKQLLTDIELTPNHTLRRLIQAWCTLNASYGIQRIPTPRLPVSTSQISKLLKDAKSPKLQIRCLKRLKSIASENETNKRFMEAAGASHFLASVIIKANRSAADEVLEEEFELTKPEDEALSILYQLQLSETSLKFLIGQNGEFIESMIRFMKSENYESRTYAVLLLKAIFSVVDQVEMITFRGELLKELVHVLKDEISPKASKAALQLLINLCPVGRNRIKASEAGAVQVIVDFLLSHPTDRRFSEMALTVLDLLCQCAEGRSELLKHGAGLSVVSKRILRVSRFASDRGVRIIHSIAKFSGSSSSVLQEMLQLGVVSNLCLVLQMDCGSKTKEKATEILKMHSRAWKNSPCLSIAFTSSYPA
ncbi:RING-type E3 ubiquitin transferase [Heracleum sosnowskyi]|uniref:U-box domain-containing protein n=1 Tax=Heracleum sosnowskyi TaxID=360622 RepID=A0AAD8MYL2_9APIA|nr:RING-type E3 ubiquitin transferase [Heracleum sosnowskyi]KAK1389715.1 RING-type E3 ubiquitin transferase [Heracleum sosnowskyi]KAK1389716.1 RING-type E3 ubiquitin transferase [Heracleum sosnowskyi]